MSKYYIDVANLSINKLGEELCGDNVAMASTDDGVIIVMSDGLGSGVKANILATLTSKIALTMLKGGASIDETIDTITNTLPECHIRKLAYSTFTIVKINNYGEVYMVEYDNPPAFFFRSTRPSPIYKNSRVINNKTIYESKFYMSETDALVIISDGVVHAGVGQLLNLGWEWNHINDFLKNILKKETLSRNICRHLIEVCKNLYDDKPGDDTTVITVKLKKNIPVSIFTGPPKNKENDTDLIDIINQCYGKKVLCGGTTANIVSKGLKLPLDIDLKNYNDEVPPMAYMPGFELVTEGLLTLKKTKDILKEYINKVNSNQAPPSLDGLDGASRLTNLLLNEGSTINIYVGQAVNPAHQNPLFPEEFNLKIKIVLEIQKLLQQLNKKVNIKYL